jgi:hypothetical protein
VISLHGECSWTWETPRGVEDWIKDGWNAEVSYYDTAVREHVAQVWRVWQLARNGHAPDRRIAGRAGDSLLAGLVWSLAVCVGPTRDPNAALGDISRVASTWTVIAGGPAGDER